MELIKIYQGNLVNARELHQFLVLEAKELNKGEQFANWIRRMLEFDFTIGEDYTTIGYNYKGEVIEENGVKKFIKSDNQRVSKRDYYLTLNCAKQIAMIQNNEKGREARRYFIRCEETLQKLKKDKRLEAFTKLQESKTLLEHIITTSLGGKHADYLQIDMAGRKVFFNGQLIPDDELGFLSLKGRDFATALTNDILSKGKHLLEDAEKINETQHGDVRGLIIQNAGKKPEELPREEKIKKLGE